MAKTEMNQDEIVKLHLVLELPRKEIPSIIEKIKTHKRYKYHWEEKQS